MLILYQSLKTEIIVSSCVQGLGTFSKHYIYISVWIPHLIFSFYKLEFTLTFLFWDKCSRLRFSKTYYQCLHVSPTSLEVRPRHLIFVIFSWKWSIQKDQILPSLPSRSSLTVIVQVNHQREIIVFTCERHNVAQTFSFDGIDKWQLNVSQINFSPADAQCPWDPFAENISGWVSSMRWTVLGYSTGLLSSLAFLSSSPL